MPPPDLVVTFLQPMLITGLPEILRPLNNSMLDRVIMNIIKMPFEIILVSNNVILKTKLPGSDIDLDLV
jgi:hypothetical protein